MDEEMENDCEKKEQKKEEKPKIRSCNFTKYGPKIRR